MSHYLTINGESTRKPDIGPFTTHFDGDAIQTASGWDIVNNQDEFIGFILDGELAELELSGLKFHKFPFRGSGRLQ